MKNALLEYKGYHGTIEPDLDEGDLMGEVLFIRDTLLYRGATVAELKSHFEETVDYYLDSCQRRGKSPDKPATGAVNLRIDRETHRAAMVAATKEGVSLNHWIGAAVTNALPKGGTKRSGKTGGNITTGRGKKKAPSRA